MLRYENMGTICIKIDLHNRNYSVIAIAKWNKETEKYTTTLYLKENSVELLDLMEKYKDVEFDSDSSSIRNDILQEVSKLNDSIHSNITWIATILNKNASIVVWKLLLERN